MILDCTQHDPDERPDFTQIQERMVCEERSGEGMGEMTRGRGGGKEEGRLEEGKGRRGRRRRRWEEEWKKEGDGEMRGGACGQ